MTRALTLLLIGTCVWTGAASAQERAREAGLLLGFASGRTVLFTADGDSVRLAYDAPHLIAPLPGGYSFIVSAQRCGVDLDSAHDGGGFPYSQAYLMVRQAVTIARAGTDAAIELEETDDCSVAEDSVHNARVRGYRAALAAANGDSSKVDLPLPGEAASNVCTEARETVTFINASAWSVERRYRQTEYCSPGGYATGGSNAMLGINDGQQIPLRPLLSASVRHAEEAKRTGEGGCAFDDAPERLDDSWIVRRVEGRWVADIWLDGNNACRGGSDYELNIALPESFTGEAPLPIPWSALVKEYPGLSDATAFPSGSKIVLFFEDSIVIRRVVGGRLGARVTRVPMQTGALVMIRWATREEASKWSHDLPALVPPLLNVRKLSGGEADILTPHTGVLVGFAERGGTHDGPDKLLTRWIAVEDGRVWVEREHDGLIVPHGSSFLRVGITRNCEADADFDDRVHCADSVWTQPASEMTVPVSRLLENPCTEDYTRIEFASPSLISLFTHAWRSDCMARSFADGNEATVLWHAADEPVAFAELGAGADAAYRKAAAAARNVGALDGPPAPQSESCKTSAEDTGWLIRRARDRWVASLFQQDVSETCMLEAPIEWELGTSVLGQNEPAANWSAIVNAIPNAEQVFASPDGRVAIVVVPAAVAMYELVNGAPGRKLLDLPRADIVMVQWLPNATGRP